MFLAFIVGAVVVSLASKSQRARQWAAIARENDLEYKPASIFSSPRINGATSGVMVDIRLLNQNKTSFVQIVAEYPDAPIDFKITKATEAGNALRNSVLGSVVENLIGEDVEVGLGPFDDLARIEGDRTELVGYLTSERIAAMSHLLEHFPGTRITQREVRVRVSGRDRSGTSLRDALRHTIATAATLSPRRLGEAAAAEPEAPAEPERGPAEPYDPWTGAHDLPAAPPAPPPTPMAYDTRSLQPLMSSSAADMAAELFEGGAVSYESERTFDRDYAGQRLSWMGHVVGSSHGWTTVKVAEIDDPLFGRTAVTVLAEEVVDFASGTPVTITGIAAELNHLERTITFEDATIIR